MASRRHFKGERPVSPVKEYRFEVTVSIARRNHQPIRCDTIALALEHAPEIDLNVDVVHIRDIAGLAD